MYDAQVREADARLKALKAQAEAKKAKADMDEISGLTVAEERVKKDVADLKKFAAADAAATRADFEQIKKNADRGLKDLQAKIDRFADRYSAWDDARERRFNARLDEADAKLKAWKATADQQRMSDVRETKNAWATLQEKVALARASAAQARREHYDAKSQQALDDAARYFDQAYDAAARQYDLN
jgi:succinate dehydrogenase flavin-adding protein (antitoxin of CptAB toxin-antitoxin module)